MDPSYVPNNPQFGVQLECNWSAGSNANLISAGSCGAVIGGQQQPSAAATDDLSACWTEDMGTFSLPLDLEPLPSLFPFSPCPANGTNPYKQEAPSFSLQPPQHQPPVFLRGGPSNGISGGETKQPAEVADVLLSLKHAVVHPHQQEKLVGGGGGDSQQQPTSLYHHHHPQVLLSPGGTYSGTICDQNYAAQAPMFPSMSVNVSMNMTMHGYHPASSYPSTDLTYSPQVQWNATPQTTTPMTPYHQSQGLLSPTYGSATYSFTADFRTQETSPPSTNSYKSCYTAAAPRRSAKHISTTYEEDMQKPNVCRICGKSYARPSTLKTHLRTHSGEKPYRCVDCNKSFSQAANLTAHVRTHSGEKPFRCPVCDRRFSQSSSVTTHMRTHSGERPYRCRLCKKAFSDSSTLTKHLRIHSGEKPYECKLCLLRFSQSGNLNRHMRVHGGANNNNNNLMPP